MGRPRTVSDKPLKAKRPNDPVYLFAKLVKVSSTQERQQLVSDVNPLFYIFGKVRKPWKDWLTYEENMNEPNGERA
jgi:hypothetical protein